MKKFVFSLQKLLSYKDQILNREKNHLRALQQRKHELEDAIERLQTALLETDRRLKGEQAVGIPVSRVLLYDYQMDSIRNQIQEQKLVLARLNTETERQIAVVVAASQEVASLEKLRDRQVEEYQKEVARENENLISEFVSSKLIREKSSQP